MSVYAVILAGGRGERLWPVSTPELPKPLMPLASGGRTLLQAAYDRVAPVVGVDGGVYLATDERMSEPMRLALGLPREQVIIEPEGRNTAPAIGLAAAFLAMRDPDAVMVVTPADHLVEREDAFRSVLRAAIGAAATGQLVTLGIRPTRPATGYGYVQRGEPLLEVEGHVVYRVARFTEKPNRETAERYVASGEHSWNAGVFVWRVGRILEEIRRLLPDWGAMLDGLSPEAFTGEGRSSLAEAWTALPSVSVDYGVLERSADVAMVPADVGWSDVGDWEAVWRALAGDMSEVAVRGRHVGQDTTRTLIWSTPGKVVATLGVRDMAIVDTPDALLITDLNRTQETRSLSRAARPPEPDWDELRGHDTEGMVSVLEAFPAQCRDALARGAAAELPPSLEGFRRVLCAGMGGSGITGDMLARLLSVEVVPHRGYTIPSTVDAETLLLGISYSGGTEETLSAFRQGLERTERAMAVTSGGALAQLCRERGVPMIEIPKGLQPRAALGYLLFSLLPWFGRLGLCPHDLASVPGLMEEMVRRYTPYSRGNTAQSLAKALHRRVPLVYGAHGAMATAALRWKTQINENAKQPAFWAELPELCHNEIVGYELSEVLLPSACVVFLRSPQDHPRIQARVDILKEVLKRRGLSYVEAWAHGGTEIEELLSMVCLGDWVSVYMALMNRVDPTPVRPIEELKKRLGSWNNT